MLLPVLNSRSCTLAAHLNSQLCCCCSRIATVPHNTGRSIYSPVLNEQVWEQPKQPSRVHCLPVSNCTALSLHPPPPASSSGPTCSFSQGVAVNGNPWLAALAQQVVLYCCC
jgi:hypothetical protein